MVRDKRTPIQLVAPPKNVRDDQEVWAIEQTGEWFVSYEAYLHRLDYYNQKRFKDEVSSRSNLTFFAAHRAERDGQQAIDADFPVVLRGPILHKAQFSTISRLDELVESLYTSYKDNILPGEEVYLLEGRNGSRSEGTVSEKTIFSGSKNHPEMARISVRLPASPGQKAEVAIVDQQHIRRKPKSFTKYNLTRFLRTSLERASYDGAPWTVKAQYAAEYGINTTVPEHLTRESVAAKKALLPKKIRSYNGIPAHWQMKNGLIVPKAGHVPSFEELEYLQARYQFAPMDVQQAMNMEAKAERRQGAKDDTVEKHLALPPPPPTRYPIEDLQLMSRANAPPRPALKDFTNHKPFPDIVESTSLGSLSMAFVGPLQQIWDTLQVFGGYYRLDGFTIDDFYGAMLVTSDAIPCQLFDEIHCTVLRNLFEVRDKETGELGELGPKTLLDAAEAKKDDAFSAEDSGSTSPTTPGDQEITLGAPTNGDVSMPDAPGNSLPRHRAAEMAGDDLWPGKVLRSEFPRGGWQMIIVSVLEQLSHLKGYSTRCNDILQHLAPPNLAASQQTAKAQYDKLDVNLRIEALQMITTLTFETKSFKAEMNQLMTDATETRKNKIEWQSQRKSLLKSLEKLQDERRRQRPEDPSASPGTEQKDGSVNGDGASTAGQQDADEDDEEVDDSAKEDSDASNPASSSEEEDDVNDSTDRRQSGRAAALKRKRDLADEREREHEEAKQTNDYQKILDAIETARSSIAECEANITSLDGDLRENACHRTRQLGHDRFFNRYIWFERNGMPFTGDAESSANYGYANGRLWVQGADALDREGTVDLSPFDEKNHQYQHKMSMQQRRDLEEGTTQLPSADAWGYYSTPEELDALTSWLKDKGEREKRLKRELVAFRDPIVASMTALTAHLAAVKRKFDDFEDAAVRPQRGVALRKRAGGGGGGEASEADKVRYPCVAWRNSWMLGTFGHLHSDGAEAYAAGLVLAGKAAGSKRGGRAKAEREREGSEFPERRTTRQGTKFAR